MTTPSRGFIALTSAILIAAVLLGITTTLSTSGYFARGDSLTSEFKRVSLGLAESCANAALLKFATNYSYAGNETISIGTDAQGIAQTCKIDTVVIKSTTVQSGVEVEKTVAITVHGIYRDTYSDLTITSTIQNPASQTVNTMLTLYTILPAGADSSLFPLSITPSVGSTIQSGISFKVTPSTAYLASVPGTPPTGYTSDFKWIGDCDQTGHITPLIGTSNSCAIYYAAEPTTATMTILVNVIGGSNVAADFAPKVDGVAVTSGSQAQYSPGTHTLSYTSISGYTTSGWDCTATNSLSLVKGQTQVCVVTFSQPALSCADTVLMLDRTGSMFYTDVGNASTFRTDWITDEENAAKAFVALYKQVTPHPQLAIGRFADKSAFVFTPSGSAEILPTALLQSSDAYYNSLPGIIHSALTNITSPVFTYAFTNLNAAISKGYAELTSIRHIAGKQKVLVLVSDGVPTIPSGSAESSATSAANTAKAGGTQIFTIHFGDVAGLNFLASLANSSANDQFVNTATAFLNPTVVRTPTVFTNPSNALGAIDALFATNGSTNDSQSYGNFHISVPSWATVSGIEAIVDAKATGSVSVQSGTLLPNAQGNYTTWNNGSSVVDESGTPSCANSDSIISTGNNTRESVRVDLSSIPNGSTITSVQVLSWDVSNGSTGGTYQPFVRVGTTDTTGNTNTASSNNGCTQRTQTINITDFTKAAGSVLEVGVLKTGTSGSSANVVRVGAIRAIVTYSQPATCTIGVQLFNKSDANGWTTQTRNILISGTEANLTPTGNSATDLWGRDWVPSDFTDTNFAMRVVNTNCSNGVTANINAMSVRVRYSGIDATAENGDGDNFFIAPTSADMTGVFTTIANEVCPAVASATQAHLYVITNVINSDGGTKQSSDFTIGVSGGSPSPSTSTGSGSGVHITLTPGASYNVTQTNSQTGYYAPYYSSSCTGSIAAGESKTCVIVNDDIPAPPPPPPVPPPPSNINIGAWEPSP